MYVTSKNIGLHNPKTVCNFHLVKAIDRKNWLQKSKHCIRGNVLRDSLWTMGKSDLKSEKQQNQTPESNREESRESKVTNASRKSTHQIRAEGGQGQGQEPKTKEVKLHTKFLVIGTLEKGDSFGFGEELTDIFLITATESECLVIPGHIMMTAERHIEVLDRESTNKNDATTTGQASEMDVEKRNTLGLPGSEGLGLSNMCSTHDIISAATMRTNNRRKSVIGGEIRKPIIQVKNSPSLNHQAGQAQNHKKSSLTQQQQKMARDSKSAMAAKHKAARQSKKLNHQHFHHDRGTGAHHYEELRTQIESKIMSEEESFRRWRQAIDWTNYKGEILSEIIERKME